MPSIGQKDQRRSKLSSLVLGLFKSKGERVRRREAQRVIGGRWLKTEEWDFEQQLDTPSGLVFHNNHNPLMPLFY